MPIKLDLPDYGELVQEVAQEIKQRVQRRTPVRTGNARDGWEVQIEGSSARITNEVEYVHFLENGTYKMAPFYMVRTTMQEVPQIIAEAMRKQQNKS